MPALTPLELGRQLQKPEGDAGIAVGQLMNQSNKIMYDEALALLDFSPGGNLLEIGFGNGAFFPEFLKKNPELRLFGADFSETMVADAAQKNQALTHAGQLQLTCANSAEMPFSDAEFAFALTINTLYFWPDALAQLKEIQRVLKPGGQFLLGFRPKEAMEKAPFTAEVFKLYSREETAELVEKAGFAIEKIQENQATVLAPDGTAHVLKGINVLARKA